MSQIDRWLSNNIIPVFCRKISPGLPVAFAVAYNTVFITRLLYTRPYVLWHMKIAVVVSSVYRPADSCYNRYCPTVYDCNDKGKKDVSYPTEHWQRRAQWNSPDRTNVGEYMSLSEPSSRTFIHGGGEQTEEGRDG